MKRTDSQNSTDRRRGRAQLPLTLLGFLLPLLLSSCSMTKNITEDDPLFTGLKSTVYLDERVDSFATHLETTKEEIEAAIATQPNGSLFGSSHYSVPWSWRLWVYNRFSNRKGAFARWMTKTFGKPPVLMSQVNPALHASVARSVLRNNGYFRGDVTYDIVPTKNPKKSKIRYTVRLDSLFTYDSIAYTNFPDTLMTLIDSTREEATIRRGDAFTLANLDEERNRLSTLMRNNGYYYYNPGYASYLADTLAQSGKTQLRLQLANGLPDEALRKWSIGNIDIQFRKSRMEQLTDSFSRGHLSIHFKGKKPPIRPSVVLKHLRLRPRQPYAYDKYQESAANINATGVFSSTNFQFTPREDTDTLDLQLNCTFAKPYDFYFETTAMGRSNGKYGPEVKLGVSRLNTFRGAEKLDVNLHGAFQWQSTGESRATTYQYGADASVEFPRIIAPFYNSDRIRRDKNGRIRRRKFYAPSSTILKIATEVVRRPQYYKMHILNGELTYRWQSSENSRHEFSPLNLSYQFKSSTTVDFDSLIGQQPYLTRALGDYFIPKMRYTYSYKSPERLRHPIRWEITVEESGNLLSLYDMIRGKKFNEKMKQHFNNPYSQFVRLETDFTKTWNLTPSSSLVGHVNAGVIFNYGNSYDAPFSEEFYVGGANSIRAFTVRDIGPGRFSDFGQGKNYKQLFYLLRNGDMKLVANLEYRAKLFGNLHGAIFLDIGNVWRLKHMNWGDGLTEEDVTSMTAEEIEEFLVQAIWYDDMYFKPSKFLNDIAIGTGVGLRYDLGFLVIRLDWGWALHLPCNNGVSGYFFNAQKFSDLHTLNFAIGYPF